MRSFNICFMLSIVPVDWVIAYMVPLYKGKGDVYECCNFRSISLLSVVGKVYGRVLINSFTTSSVIVIWTQTTSSVLGVKKCEHLFISNRCSSENF